MRRGRIDTFGRTVRGGLASGTFCVGCCVGTVVCRVRRDTVEGLRVAEGGPGRELGGRFKTRFR